MHTSRAALALGLIAVTTTMLALGLASRGSGDGAQLASQSTLAASGPGEVVVHEWGTFTSFSGSDSVKLEFRPLADADLPPFVLDRGRQAGVNPNPFLKVDLRVLQRMETPVTYFYTDRERQVKVRVGFPQGLLTEFFPPVERQTPEYKWTWEQPLTGSLLDWGQVWLIPPDRLGAGVADARLAAQLQASIERRLLPRSEGHEHYAFARETDSALVFVERPGSKGRPLAPRGAFFEKFLFYRGVGNFELPLQLTAQPGGRFELRNTGADDFRSLFLVTVEGDKLRFARHAGIGAGQRIELVQSKQTASLDELAEAVVAALIEEGLFEKEARAMVKTWRSSWFGEEGTRLFYLLPQPLTDALLPLEIEPRPDKIVRVMVGRLEIMRPEDEARITALIAKSSRDRASQSAAQPDRTYALPQAIIDLGRLAEPALVRVQTIAADPETRSEAERLLDQLRQHRNAQPGSEVELAPESTEQKTSQCSSTLIEARHSHVLDALDRLRALVDPDAPRNLLRKPGC